MTVKLPAPTSDTSSARSATPVRVKRNAPSIPENPPASRSRAAGKGAPGFHCETPAEVEQAIEEAFALEALGAESEQPGADGD